MSHPASLVPARRTAGIEPVAASSSSASSGSVSSATSKYPDLFLPRDGSPSLGYADPRQGGKGAGVCLDAERAGASFDSQELMHLLYGGPAKLARRRSLFAVIENDPVFRRWDSIFLSRPERMRRAREKGAAAVAHAQRLGLKDPIELAAFFSHVSDGLPSELHRSMFVPTLMSQASEEQQAAWLKPALAFATLGTYAQTELGHGSFVRGMESTATYDPATQEFVLNSPTLESTKWWPGNLGRNTTHAIFMARLITAGVDHGVHAFYLQLRDPSTYAVLPGITVGDIGPKVGYECNDNGFLSLAHVRVPRFNMLARYAQVTETGVYERAPSSHAKAAFGTMVFVRSMIVVYAARYLAMSLTIAIRYSAVRHQFPDPSSQASAGGQGAPREMSVLNYQTQQHTLFCLLATAFAEHFTGSYMRRMYEANQKNLARGDTRLLAELHATSSGLKSVTTTLSADGIEACRKACGGHDVPACTYEGDNIVMFLQTARALIKTFGGVRAGKLKLASDSVYSYMVDAASILADPKAAAAHSRSTLTEEQLAEGNVAGHEAQRALYAHRVTRLVLQAVGDLAAAARAYPDQSKDFHWEQCKVILVQLARAHCFYVLVRNFHAAIDSMTAKSAAAAAGNGSSATGPSTTEGKRSASLSPALLRVLRRLCSLFCLSWIEKDLGDFTVDGFLSQSQANAIRLQVLALLKAIRPDAVAIVDSFDFSDHFLNSALGRFDGDVYGTMWEWANRNPLNQPEALPGAGIREHVIPMLERGRAKL